MNKEATDKLLLQPGEPGQVLATINGNVTITRQDLAEYLITRYGPEALEFLLNRKIVEKECRAKGITVSDDEIKTAYQTELARISVDEKKFVADFLAPNGKTLFEWQEDLLRPKLMMSKLVHEQLTVTDEDLHKAFDATYGERIEGKLVMWKEEEKRYLLSQYRQLCDNEADFESAAARQFNPALAAKHGEVRPFARNTTGIPALEDAAFKLQPGEVSAVLELPEGLAIFKCLKRLPPQAGVKFEDKKAELTPIVVEHKTEAMIPVVFSDLRTKANPKLLLKDYTQPEDLEESVRHAMDQQEPGRRPNQPHSN